MISDALRDDTRRLCPWEGPVRQAPPALRVLGAANGGFSVTVETEAFVVQGDRMLLLDGACDYDAMPLTEGAQLSVLAVGAAQTDAFPQLSLGVLRAAWPAFAWLSQQVAVAISFTDADGLAAGTAICMALLSGQASGILLLTHGMLAIAEMLEAETRDARIGNRHVRKALRVIHARYMTDLTAAEIAQAVGIHAGHLHRLFLADTGCQVHAYLMRLRIDKAKLLLMGTGDSVAAVARAVGMPSPQQFSRAFRRQTGLSPQAFRQVYDVTCDYAQAHRHYYTAMTTERFLQALATGQEETP